MIPAPTHGFTYAQFLAHASRHDVYLFDITLPDADGVEQTLRWSTRRWRSGPDETPASVYWEPRVQEGGIDYETAAFDPENSQFGALAPNAPSALVVYQDDGDLDALMDWHWSKARVVVRHGGWVPDAGLLLEEFATIATHEVDGIPIFGLDTVTIPLRSVDLRLQDVVERRTLYSLGWCVEGDGVDARVNFAPFAPGIHERARYQRGHSGTNATYFEIPEAVAENDLMLAWISHHANGGSPYLNWEITSAPAGWSLLGSAVITSSGIAVHRIYLYSKVASSTDGGSQVSWAGTGTPPNHVVGFVALYGHDGSTPTISVTTNTGSSTTSLVAPSVTTTRVHSLAIWGIVSRGQLAREATAPPLPAGTTELHKAYKGASGGGQNAVGMRTFYEYRPSTGATGTRTITMPSNSAFAAIGVVVHNRAPGGQPEKLKLKDTLSLQFGMIPYTPTGNGDQHLLGWNAAAPWRLVIDDDGCLRLDWVTSATPASTVFGDIVLEAEHRYHVDLIWTSTQQILRVYDWEADTLTEQAVNVAAVGRDDPAGKDTFSMLCGFEEADGTTPEHAYDGQLWSTRLWTPARSREQMDDTRTRPLTEAERQQASLVHYVPWVEKTGSIAGDLSLDPADGELQGTAPPAWRPTLTGTDEQLGEQVPCVFGGPHDNVPGLAVETAVDGSYFVVHPSAVADILSIQEGGAARDIEAEYVVGGLRDFLATLPEEGAFSIYRGPSGTYYRCAVEPVLPMSATVIGEESVLTLASPTDRLWRSAPEIVAHVLRTRGEQPFEAGDFDSTWAAVHAAMPKPCGAVVEVGETRENFARRLLGTIGAIAFAKRDGKLSCLRWTAPSGAPVLALEHMIVEDSIRPSQVAEPVIFVTARARRNYQPLDRDQISGDVTDPAKLRALMTEWNTVIRQKPWAVAALHPNGREIEVDLYFTGGSATANAAARATEIRELASEPGQIFELQNCAIGQLLELGDVVSVRLTDRDRVNARRERLRTHSGALFRVAYLRSERLDGLVTLRLWRPTQAES